MRILLILSVLFSINYNMLYSETICDRAISNGMEPCCDHLSGIPPNDNIQWIAGPISVITVYMPDGKICEACVCFCYRQPMYHQHHIKFIFVHLELVQQNA